MPRCRRRARTARRSPAAELRAEPEDFRVEEELSFVPSGDGPHWLLRVEKRAANTRWVAAEIARLGEWPVAEVGYAGLKDRHAITRAMVQRAGAAASGGILERRAHGRIPSARRARERAQAEARRACPATVSASACARRPGPGMQLDSKLAALRAHGAPNYFGPQRFGRDGFNLDRAAQWMQSGTPPAGRAERGFALSAARALHLQCGAGAARAGGGLVGPAAG